MPSVESNVAVQFPDRPLQSDYSGSVPDSAWSEDGTKLYVASMTRAYKDAYLTEVDVATGAITLALMSCRPPSIFSVLANPISPIFAAE